PKLSDGKALFHADHKNIATGGISVSGLDAARQMMRLQKEGDRALNIRPAFMLVPVALETVANQTIKSASVKGADANAGVINPIQNFAEVIAEARLDAADPKTWYLAAAQGTDTIEVAWLDGVDTPYIDQQEGFTTDGIATKIRIDAGV
ncbi:Mu-like prophage major head subunit gpT family protein, partial [Escherichia coli]|nr:Mu-like prophage major head subunit gpT family protein [Escherichia coli]